MGGNVTPLADKQARWINFESFGSSYFNYGVPGSVLYAVPFWVNTTSITSATITMEGGVDDNLGDWYSGGPNPDGCYINGFPTSVFTVSTRRRSSPRSR